MHKSEDFMQKWVIRYKERKNRQFSRKRKNARNVGKKSHLQVISAKVSVDIAIRTKVIGQKESKY